LNWTRGLKAANDKLIAEKTAAGAAWQQDLSLGLTTRTTFSGWLLDGNGALYKTALKRANGIQVKINQLQLKLNGRKSDAFGRARDGLERANSDELTEG
jgi:hypothetical protein